MIFVQSSHAHSISLLDELEQERSSWSIGDHDTDLKESSISIKAKQLVDMVLTTLQGAAPLSADA